MGAPGIRYIVKYVNKISDESHNEFIAEDFEQLIEKTALCLFFIMVSKSYDKMKIVIEVEKTGE